MIAPVNLDETIRIYYTYPEIGNAEIKKIFGPMGSFKMTRLKNMARVLQDEKEIKTMGQYSVNTELAFKAWGIDIAKLERSKEKLNKLGL